MKTHLAGAMFLIFCCEIVLSSLFHRHAQICLHRKRILSAVRACEQFRTPGGAYILNYETIGNNLSWCASNSLWSSKPERKTSRSPQDIRQAAATTLFSVGLFLGSQFSRFCFGVAPFYVQLQTTFALRMCTLSTLSFFCPRQELRVG